MKSLKDILEIEAKKFHLNFEGDTKNTILSFTINHKSWMDFFDLLHSHHLLQFDKLVFLTGQRQKSTSQIITYVKSKIWPNQSIIVRTSVPEEEEIQSLSSIWPYVEWLEQETSQVYGIRFSSSSSSLKSVFARFPVYE